MSEELAEDITDAIQASKETDLSHLATKGELDTKMAQLETKIEAVKTEIIKWIIGIGFAQFAAILTMLKLH